MKSAESWDKAKNLSATSDVGWNIDGGGNKPTMNGNSDQGGGWGNFEGCWNKLTTEVTSDMKSAESWDKAKNVSATSDVGWNIEGGGNKPTMNGNSDQGGGWGNGEGCWNKSTMGGTSDTKSAESWDKAKNVSATSDVGWNSEGAWNKPTMNGNSVMKSTESSDTANNATATWDVVWNSAASASDRNMDSWGKGKVVAGSSVHKVINSGGDASVGNGNGWKGGWRNPVTGVNRTMIKGRVGKSWNEGGQSSSKPPSASSGSHGYGWNQSAKNEGSGGCHEKASAWGKQAHGDRDEGKNSNFGISGNQGGGSTWESPSAPAGGEGTGWGKQVNNNNSGGWKGKEAAATSWNEVGGSTWKPPGSSGDTGGASNAGGGRKGASWDGGGGSASPSPWKPPSAPCGDEGWG